MAASLRKLPFEQQNGERPDWVDSTYWRTEVADVQHPKGNLSARGCCIPESSHWRSDRLGAPNDRYEAVTGSSPCGHEQQQPLQSRSRHLKVGFRLVAAVQVSKTNYCCYRKQPLHYFFLAGLHCTALHIKAVTVFRRTPSDSYGMS